MVANEIGSGQVDVFLGDAGGRWTTSSSVGITATCRSSRLVDETITRGVVDPGGGGGVSTASARATPPGGNVTNLNRDDVGWVDTSQESDIGPSETDEKGGAEHDDWSSTNHQSDTVFSSSCIQQQSQRNSVRHLSSNYISSLSETASTTNSVLVHRLLSSFVNDDVGLRISQHSHGDAKSASSLNKGETEDIRIGVVNDALDAPQDDQQHDDKMPHQSHPHQHNNQESGWTPDCDETSLPDLSGGVIMHPPLKSALKRPTTGGSRGLGVAGLQSLSRKKARVRFNEALNTFLECDYVIYVDDDEYDLLYHLDAVAAAAAAAAAAQAEAAAAAAGTGSEQPQLVNVRSFELQLPETSLTSTCVSHAGSSSSPAGTATTSAAPGNVHPNGASADSVTLSPPDGYKDAAAFYAAAAALVDLENHSGKLTILIYIQLDGRSLNIDFSFFLIHFRQVPPSTRLLCHSESFVLALISFQEGLVPNSTSTHTPFPLLNNKEFS